MVLTAKEVMDRGVLLVPPETTVGDCVRRMVEDHTGYAVVAPPDRPVLGIITEWDILAKVVAPGRDPAQLVAREIMSAPVTSCGPDDDMEVVVRKMSELGIRRMLVAKDGRVVGIITSKIVLHRFREYVDRVSRQVAGFHVDASMIG